MNLTSRDDYIALMHTMLDPLKGLYSPGGARLHLGDTGVTYDERAIELEAFSRPLWALVPFWAGGGRDEEFTAIYRRGLVCGTDPQSSEYWGGFQDYDQRFVEMAALACGLLYAPQMLWDPLTQEQQKNLAAWLDGINHYFIPQCNWQFFRVLVNVALKKHGMLYSEEKLQESLATIESFYLGGGWYSDGASQQKDYYISFAMHYYGLVYARLMEQQDPERSATFKERAVLFAQDFIYWFADDGAALPFGRSLTYRFAEVSFWCACLFAGVTPYPLGVMKGLISRHLNWWMAQKMFDRDGILTIGYAYPNLLMAERYNAPGSPYWSMKTFLILALPDEHPFWKVQPQPMPELCAVKALPYADMLMHRRNGDVTAYTPGVCEQYGHGQVPQKYAKFAYSTKFGFSIARSNIVLHENAPDSMLAFVPDGDDTVFVRKYCTAHTIAADRVVSTWSPCPGITVTTTVFPMENGHMRRHEIVSSLVCTAHDCGFAVQKFCDGFAEEAHDKCATVRNSTGGCTVSGEGKGEVIEADPNTNVLFQNTKIPAIVYRIPKGKTVLETTVTTF